MEESIVSLLAELADCAKSIELRALCLRVLYVIDMEGFEKARSAFSSSTALAALLASV